MAKSDLHNLQHGHHDLTALRVDIEGPTNTADLKILNKDDCWNSVFRDWVPKWLSVPFLLFLFMPIMTCGSLYSSISADTVGTLQLWSEDFTFVSICGMVGTCAAGCLFYKVACVRRHRLMFLWGFGLWIALGEICLHSTSVPVMCLCNVVFGALRLLLMAVNFATFARLLLKRDFRYMLGPEGDGHSTKEWDDIERGKSAMVPFANFYFMSIATAGIWLGSWFANKHLWSDVPHLWNFILAACMFLIFILERPRDFSGIDESAMKQSDPLLSKGMCPFLPWRLDGGLKYIREFVSICLIFGSPAFIFIYGRTMGFGTKNMYIALTFFILGILGFTAFNCSRKEEDRYFRMELFKYKNVWIAIIIYTIANVLNTSSALTNVISGITLRMDTYTQNQLTNWGVLGYLIGCIIVVVGGIKFKLHYRWIMAIGFGIFGYTMWWAYNGVQMNMTYESIRNITVIRSCGHFILYCICMIYAYQRLPYRLMPSWICLMIGGRSIIGPSLGAALYGLGMQRGQLEHLAVVASPLQSVILTVKELSGYTMWGISAFVFLLVFAVPWKKRNLKPEEIPLDFAEMSPNPSK